MQLYTPDNIEKLEPNEIFVFGSNEGGIHGKGAAKQALNWGAIYGQGSGPQGRTYAIPTKDRHIRTLPLSSIFSYVSKFIDYTTIHKDRIFLVTRIGCGLAGYRPSTIAPLFASALDLPNISLPRDFVEEINAKR
jgi:hypothetical protein